MHINIKKNEHTYFYNFYIVIRIIHVESCNKFSRILIKQINFS